MLRKHIHSELSACLVILLALPMCSQIREDGVQPNDWLGPCNKVEVQFTAEDQEQLNDWLEP